MRPPLIGAALRVMAVLIAVAAVIDPVFTRPRPVSPPVVIARLTSTDIAAVEAALRSALPEAEVSVRPAIDGRVACAPGESCVMVSDGSVDAAVPDDLTAPLSLITLDAPDGPNVAVRAVTAPRTHHAAAAGSIRVALAGTGVQGRRTDVSVTDGGATVGAASHEWKTDGEAAIDVPWWPLAEGPRTLRVSATAFAGEATAVDNAVDVGVQVAPARAPVLVYEARPSWASTFVRRALEDDPRFLVEHRVGLGPTLAAGTAGARLESRVLDAASVAIIGSLESLTANDVTLLERFASTRGGTLILLPDRAPTGAAARLFRGRWTEHLEATPSPAGALRASETLRLAEPSPFDIVLGTIKGSAVTVLSPVGDGRVVVSGAMDAWRYRDADAGAFDRFWRSLVLESAAGSAPLTVTFESAIAKPGSAMPFVVRHRRMEPEPTTAITATSACGDRASTAVRLWPGGAQGVFTGTMPVDGLEPCRLSLSIDGGPSIEGGVAVTTGATATLNAVQANLERVVSRSGGVVATAGDEGAVAAALAALPTPADEPEPVHPMRSPWWMFPFVTCLTVEWWLRRRAGLR